MEQCGFYDEAAALVEDLDLWFRVGWRWEFCNVPEALVSYRIWPGSLTSQKLRSLAWRAHRVRSCAARGLGYRRPSWARFYSLATLAAALFPAGLIRSLFEWGLRLREPTADPDSLGSLDLNPAGGPRDLEWAAGKKLLEHHRP